MARTPSRDPLEYALSHPARLRSFRLTVVALLFVSAPAAWVAVVGLTVRLESSGHAGRGIPEPWTTALVAAGATLLVAAAGLVLRRRPEGPWCALPGALACQLPIAAAARWAPGLALVGWGWSAALVYLAFRQAMFVKRSERADADDAPDAVLSMAVLASGSYALVLSGWSAGVGLMQESAGRVPVVMLLLSAAVAATLAEWRLVLRGRIPRGTAIALSVATGIGALALVPVASVVLDVAAIALAARLLVAVSGAARAHELRASVLGFLWARPALLVVTTFSLLSLGGGLVLTFPACSADGVPLDPIDALFTAVSASCVTGLAVRDTAGDFSGIGQVVILGLIQVGGLGIMTLSALATLLLGGRLAGRAEGALGDIVGTDAAGNAARLLRPIAISTLAIEAVGASLLLPGFLSGGRSFGEALWKAVFHSVSAFCNAGFSLQSDSLLGWQDDPVVLHVVGLLILLGGVGFGVLHGLGELLRRRVSRAGLQVRLVLWTNGVLLLVAFLVWLLLEGDGVLSGLGFGDRIHNAWLQTVTLRTAGFTSVGLEDLGHATLMMTLVWMFIGASPGSTGGGIKTTTVAVLVAAVLSVVRGRADVEAFGRSIPHAVVYRAAAMVTISAAIVFSGAFALMLTQGFTFEQVLFEATSAFGTVGLSLGITPELDRTGKVVVMALMFVGRTGPLTMVLLFRRRDPAPTRYPAEEVMVG